MRQENPLKHVAIIMDGNGRWAKNRGHSRTWGHIRGAKVVSKIIETASKKNVEALTLYSFSTENWSRPIIEIQTIFMLLDKYLQREQQRILDNDICFKVMGDILGLPQKTIKRIDNLEKITRSANGLKLTFAFGYGGRTDIVSSVNKFIAYCPNKKITEKDIKENLSYPDIGDVDILIRTGGNQRISNFLLWQVAYAEIFFTKTKWPEFNKKEFEDILDQFSTRERRFGAVSKSVSLQCTTDTASQQKNSFLQSYGT